MINNERKILHVDDDPAITKIVQMQLAERGYASHCINDANEAMGELMRGDYRVVLLDVDMPNIDGMTLLHRIKEFDGGIQVIMLTGLVGITTAMETLHGGAEACLFKPLESIDPLVDTLDSVFCKIDRWWTTLNELMRRKQEVTV